MVLMLVGVGCSDGHGGGMHASSAVIPGAREMQVRATSFAFDPDALEFAVGEDVTIVLSSDDVFHDFEIEGVDGHVGAGAGRSRRGGFRIDEPGTYRFFCTVSGHRKAGMEGVVVVS